MDHKIFRTELQSKQTELAARAALDGRRKGMRAFLLFAWPAIIASVDYMDPGFATKGSVTLTV